MSFILFSTNNMPYASRLGIGRDFFLIRFFRHHKCVFEVVGALILTLSTILEY